MLEFTENELAMEPPNNTAETLVNPVPEITTDVPPFVDPVDVDSPVTAGADIAVTVSVTVADA